MTKFNDVLIGALKRRTGGKLTNDLIANALLERSELIDTLIDPRRDIDAECHYPSTGEITADQLKNMYDRDPIACRVVQCLAKQSWQVQPSVYEAEDPEIKTAFEEAWDSLQPMVSGKSWYKSEEAGSIWEYLIRADILSGIGHFGVLLMGFDDGKDLQEPVEGAMVVNAFCATGEGGGQDNSCSPQTDTVVKSFTGANSAEKLKLSTSHLKTIQRELIKAGYKKEYSGTKKTAASKLGRSAAYGGAKSETLYTYKHANGKVVTITHRKPKYNNHEIVVKHQKSSPIENTRQYTQYQDCYLTRTEEDNLRKLPNLNEQELAVLNSLARQREFVLNYMQAQEDKKYQQQEKKQGTALFGDTSSLSTDSSASANDDKQFSQRFGLKGEAEYKPSPMGTDQQYFGVQFGPSEQPATEATSKKKLKLLFLRPFDESLVQIVRYEWNINNPRFGMPVMYRITLNDPREQHSGVGLPMATVFVHWSRVIHLADNLNSSEIFGTPRCRPVFNRLLDLQKIYGASAEGYWQAAFTGLALETHPQLGGDVTIDSDDVRDQIENYINSLQRYLALTGMSAHTLAPQVSDPSNQIDKHLEAICIQLEIPKRVFMGSERGELASSQDDASWNDRLKARQQGYITPRIIVPFVDRLIAVGVLPEPDYVEPEEPEEEDEFSEEDTFGAGGGGYLPDEFEGEEDLEQPSSIDNQPVEKLNGAQIEAALELMFRVSEGEIAPEAAVELLIGIGISQERADRMINSQSTLKKVIASDNPEATLQKIDVQAQLENPTEETEEESAIEEEEDDRSPAGLLDNVFCATGKGGGIDPSCSDSKTGNGKLKNLSKIKSLKKITSSGLFSGTLYRATKTAATTVHGKASSEFGMYVTDSKQIAKKYGTEIKSFRANNLKVLGYSSPEFESMRNSMPRGVSIQEVKNKAKELGWDAINIGGTEGIVILGGKNKRLTKNTKATLPLGAKWVHGRVGEIYQYNGKIFKVKTPVINAALEEPNEEDEPIEEDVLTEEDDLMEKEDVAAKVEEEGEEADPLLEDDTAEQIGVKTPKGYCVVWPDLESNTDLSKAQIAATKTQAMATYVGGNVESIMPLIHFYTKILGLSDEEAADLVKAAEEQEAEMAMEQQMQNPFGGGGQPPFGQQPPMPGMPGQEPPPPFSQEPGQFPPTEEETFPEEEEIEDEGKPTNPFDQTENQEELVIHKTNTEGEWVTTDTGAHIFIQDGKITKGPKSLIGKSPQSQKSSIVDLQQIEKQLNKLIDSGWYGNAAKTEKLKGLYRDKKAAISKIVSEFGGLKKPPSKQDLNKLKHKLAKGGAAQFLEDQVENDPQVKELVAKGKMFSGEYKIKQPMKNSQCHWNVAKLFAEKKIDAIVIGITNNPSNGEHGWIQHTWGLKEGKIVETTKDNFKNERYFGIVLKGKRAEDFVRLTNLAPPGSGVVRKAVKAEDLQLNNDLRFNQTENVFCPTGEGGGVDPSCGGDGASEGNSSELDTTSSAVDFDADPRSVEKYSKSPKTPKISQKKTDEVYAKLKDGGFLDNDGNLVLYHLTLDDEDIIKSIKERGLVPRASEPSGQDWVGDHAPYATYFLGGGAQGKDTAIDQNEQLEGTIVEARIPVTKELLSRIIPDEEADDNAKKGIDTLLGGGAIAIIGGVPAKYLKYSNDKSRESKVETPPTTKAFPKLPKGARWVKDLEGTYYDLKGKLYRIENKTDQIENVFCPTGEGGGIDPSCGGEGGGQSKSTSSKQTSTPEFKKWFGKSKVVDKQGAPLRVYHGTKASIEQFDEGKIGSATGNTGWFGKGFYMSASAEDASYYAEMGSRTGEGANIVPVYVNIEKPLVIHTIEEDQVSDVALSIDKDAQNTIRELEGWTDEEKAIIDEELSEDAHSVEEILPCSGDDPTIPPARFTEVLKKNGYDGVIVHSHTITYDTDGKTGDYDYDNPIEKIQEYSEIVAFYPHQIKSATGNRGKFDPKDPIITHSSN